MKEAAAQMVRGGFLFGTRFQFLYFGHFNA